ncbi:hypothetical protein HED55_13815 [Ochrobactrum haematophilum]|uniref:Uncharacterized protein n=1 Tax=Brucella haematophila TaxID=419474 RepID=A0ABX1DQP2_9HYPH|nr:hypothetical protein [Brucella haematophila]
MTDTSNIVKHPAAIERDEPEARQETHAESTGPAAQPQSAIDAALKPSASDIAARRRLKRRRMMFFASAAGACCRRLFLRHRRALCFDR